MCSSRGTGESASTAEISTAGTTRTPSRSPAAMAPDKPLTVSWSDSASSSTPASAARWTTSAADSAPSEWVECDCRSKRGAMRAPAYAIGSEAGVLVCAVALARAGQRGDAVGDDAALAAHGRVVAVGLLVQQPVAVGVGGFERGVCRVGVGGAQLRVQPQDLQVGDGRALLVLGDGVGVLELAQHRDHLGHQPALRSE